MNLARLRKVLVLAVFLLPWTLCAQEAAPLPPEAAKKLEAMQGQLLEQAQARDKAEQRAEDAEAKLKARVELSSEEQQARLTALFKAARTGPYAKACKAAGGTGLGMLQVGGTWTPICHLPVR